MSREIDFEQRSIIDPLEYRGDFASSNLHERIGKKEVAGAGFAFLLLLGHVGCDGWLPTGSVPGTSNEPQKILYVKHPTPTLDLPPAVEISKAVKYSNDFGVCPPPESIDPRLNGKISHPTIIGATCPTK